MKRLPDRLDRWLTVRRPVTYWSFWRALLGLFPLLLALFALLSVATGTGFTFTAFAPLPFVFVAATFGYAVRDLNASGGLVSLLVGAVYGFVLWLTGAGWVILQRPRPLLSIIAALAFVAMVAGFASPTLHGPKRDREFTRAYEEHKKDD